MFQNDTVLKGILGILCPLWALIWGWMEADRVNHKNVMIVWSIAIAAGIVLNVMTVMNNPGLQGGGAPALPPAMLIPGL
jgi:hypothetical protein